MLLWKNCLPRSINIKEGKYVIQQINLKLSILIINILNEIAINIQYTTVYCIVYRFLYYYFRIISFKIKISKLKLPSFLANIIPINFTG